MLPAGPNPARTLVSVLAAALGLTLVLAAVIWMNRQSVLPKGDDGKGFSAVSAERKEKPKPERKVERREPPKRQPQRSPAPPAVDLGNLLGGMDFGLPQYEAADLSDLSGSLLGSNRDVVMTDSSVDVPPRPVVQTAIPYPLRAKAQGVRGYVLLSVLISPTGQVERVKVLEAQPAGVFEAAAEAGVKTWKFEPATYKGEAVRVWATQRVRFDLS